MVVWWSPRPRLRTWTVRILKAVPLPIGLDVGAPGGCRPCDWAARWQQKVAVWFPSSCDLISTVPDIQAVRNSQSWVMV